MAKLDNDFILYCPITVRVCSFQLRVSMNMIYPKTRRTNDI